MRSLAIVFSLLFIASAARADGIPEPGGEVILYIGGDIEITNMQGPVAAFDRAMLEDIGMHTVTTTTPFTYGVISFEGPLLRDVLVTVMAQGDNVTVVALDEYESTFPISDAYDHDFILAVTDDQGLVSPDQFGPIWIVGPWDDDPVIGEEEMHNRWIWQVNWIDVN